PRVVTRPTGAPRPSTMAFVTSVVPWASEAKSGASASMPAITATAGAAGVVGTLHDHVRPDGSRATRSVNVPPTSTPTRTPGVMVRGGSPLVEISRPLAGCSVAQPPGPKKGWRAESHILLAHGPAGSEYPRIVFGPTGSRRTEAPPGADSST